MPTPRTLLRSNNERGQVFVFLAVMLVVLLGCAALVIDVGRAYLAKRHLQASADAAATAGALELPDPIAAQTFAANYSGQDGAKNDNNKLPARLHGRDDEVPLVRSLQPGEHRGGPADDRRADDLREGARHRPVHDQGDGDSLLTVLVETARHHADPRPYGLDVPVLEWEQRSRMYRPHNAKNGLLEFVQYMDPAIHKIGLAVFPPRTSSGSACSTPASSNYNSTSAVYTVVPLSNNYKIGSNLNESSSLVSTIRCQRGGGSTAYAHALEKAQTELISSRGRPGVQNVIVFFSDGAANTGPTYLSSSSPYRTQPCHQGVNSANVIKATGTLIYSIGYDLDALGGGANICQIGVTGANESPAITAYSAISQIATNGDTFFNRPNPGDLTRVYTQIAAEIGGTRIIPNEDGS